MYKWNFPEYNGFKKEGRNAIEIDNRESPIQTFAREVCQNSTDAAVSYPVRLEISEYEIDAKSFPDLEGLRHVLECCKKEGESLKYNMSTRDYYDSCLRSVSGNKIRMLRISDFNTKGLTGSTEKGSSAWNNVTVGTGISDKTEGSAGSHGRGKDSFYEISSIRTVFFSTLDKDGIEASIGISRQMTFFDGNVTRDSLGCYLDENNEFSKKQISLDPDFTRNEPGTDVYIAGFSKYDDDEYQIILALIRDFFVMILDKKLIISVNGLTIDHNNVMITLSNLKGRNDEEKNVIKYTKELIECYLKGPVKECDSYSVYLSKSEDFFYVTTTRKGMVIDSRFHKLPQDHIIGLIAVEKQKVSDLLLTSEDISHNSWKPDRAPEKNRASIKGLILQMKTDIREQANKMIEEETGPTKDAEGLNRYIPIVRRQTESDIEVAKKEFLYDPIRKTTMAKKKFVESKTEYAAPTEKEIMPTAENTDDEDTQPIHPNKDDPIPYSDLPDHVIINEGGNEDYTRQFYQINLKDVKTLCTEPSAKRYKVYYKCDKDVPYYIKAFISSSESDLSEPLDIISAIDNEGNSLPISDGRVGPLNPNGGVRTYVFLTIDYPIPCAIRIGGEIE